MNVEDLKAMLDAIALDMLHRSGVRVVVFKSAEGQPKHVFGRVVSNCAECGKRFTQSYDFFSKLCYSCRPKDEGFIWNRTQPDPPMFPPEPLTFSNPIFKIKK